MGGISIDNKLPAGLNLRVAGSSNTCDTTPEVLAATEEYNLTDVTIDVNDQCVITMQTNGIGFADIGSKEFSTTNFTDGFTTYENASATLTILPEDPTVEAIFNPDTVNPGETTNLTVTLSNSNPVELTNISIANDLPAGLRLNASQSSNTCDTSPTVTAASGIYNLTNATLPANGDCTINIQVNGIGAADAGVKIFSTADFTNGVDTFANTMDVLTVKNAQPTVSGGFNQANLIVGQQGTLTYTVTNNAPIPLTNVNFIIDLPSQLDLDTNSVVTNATCDASPSASGGSDAFALTNASIAANGNCVVLMTFTTNSVGSFTTQAIGPLTNNETDDVTVPAPMVLDVMPMPPVTINGAFDQASVIIGQQGTLTYNKQYGCAVNRCGVFDQSAQRTGSGH